MAVAPANKLHPGLLSTGYALWLILAAVIICNILIYSRVADGPYIMDDYPNLVENEFLMIDHPTPRSIRNAMFSSPASRFHRPISMLTFTLNYSLSGTRAAFPVKLTNILLHALTGLGIFLLTGTLLRNLDNRRYAEGDRQSTLIALLVTFVWLFHPLFVSTVLYTIQRMAILSTLFIVYGCLFYLHLRRHNLASGRWPGAPLLLILLATPLAFFSKENGILLPGFLLLIELFCFRFAMHRSTSGYYPLLLKSILLLPVIFIVVYLFYSYIDLYRNDISSYYFTVNERLLTQFRVMWHYAGWLTLLSPEPMSIYHDNLPLSKDLFTPATTFAALLAWICVIFLTVRHFRSRNILVFCVLWFLWGHILESTVLPLSLMFEHRNYLPGYGLILGLVTIILRFLLLKDFKKSIAIPVIGVVLVAIPLYTLIERTSAWRDSRSLALSLLQTAPDSPSTMLLVAKFLMENGDNSSALQAIQHAQQLDRQESLYILAEAAIQCEARPDMPFEPELIKKIGQLPLSGKSTVTTVHQFRKLTQLCHQSRANDEVLLELYRRFSVNRNEQLVMLAYFGIGVINLHAGSYAETIRAWERAIASHYYADSLRPDLERVKLLLGETNPSQTIDQK